MKPKKRTLFIVCLWINMILWPFNIVHFVKDRQAVATAKQHAREIVNDRVHYKVSNYYVPGNGLHSEEFTVTLFGTGPNVSLSVLSLTIDENSQSAAAWFRIQEGDEISLNYVAGGHDSESKKRWANYIEPRKVNASL